MKTVTINQAGNSLKAQQAFVVSFLLFFLTGQLVFANAANTGFTPFSLKDTSGEVQAGKEVYKLPEPGDLPSASSVTSALGTAGAAAQALTADATAEKNNLKAAEAELKKTEPMKEEYMKGLNAYTANGYNPYMEDLNRYEINNTKYKEVVGRHNDAVAANNALPATQRDPATVEQLNKNKAELDDWKGKLDRWEKDLTDKKAGLDRDRAALLLQKSNYEAAYAAAMAKIRASQLKLKNILEQLLNCKKYADACMAILKNKFRVDYTGKYSQGVFGSKEYKASVADLNTDLERLKRLSDTPWDGRSQ